MNAEWISFLSKSGMTIHGGVPAPVSEQLRVAQDGMVISALADFGLIRASGPDAATFLHNLLTNDIVGIDAKTARFAGMCTPKGRLIASMLIWKDSDDFLLMLSADLLAPILKKLSMYVLRSKVKLTDATADLVLIGVAKPGEVGNFNDAMATLELAAITGGKVIRLDASRWLLAATPMAAIDQWNALNEQAPVVGNEVWQWLEIQAGQPRIVAATQEAFVPQMLNMELPAVAGVSFTKGCYPGQEIVARTQYLGKIKRRMFLVHIDGSNSFGPGVPVFSAQTGEQQCGTVVSCALAPGGGFDALICVQTSAAEASEINLGSPTGPRPRVLALPYSLELGGAESGST